MTDDRLERMKELFAACLEQPPQARSVFLDEACPTDLNLREEVSRLLAEYDEASDFLENPPLPVSVLRASWQGFVPGEIISNRYIILGLIAEGGMGRVYEAEDRELKIRVALKAIRSEIASGEQAIEHLKHEIYAARTVAHPNVCRIFDLGYHQIGPDSKIAFMTMELLSGETLSSFLKRTQRMTAQEALPIVEQMALGLDAAHKAGVIHRDFKSSNTILVPCDGKSLRVVITDFGLARVRVGSESVTALSSCSSQIFGTLDYMSPEQLRGERVGRATDLYALGIVMYEMVTGVRPFAADTPMAGALRRLEMKPQSPRKHIPSLDRRWEKTILRCLEASPHNRFASAQDVVQSLRGEIPLAHPGWQRWIMAAAIIGLFVLSLVGFRSYRRTQLGRKSQLAQVRFKEGLELQEKGQLEKAQAAFEEARRLYVAVGSRIDIVKVLDRTGDVFSQRGDWAQAKKSYEEALAVCREIGAEKPAASLLTGVGIVLHYQGDLAGARKSYEEALEIYRKINDRDGMAKVLKDLGNVAPTQTEAERYYEQALAVAREIGDRSGVGFALDDVGVILNIEGHLSAARKTFEEEASIFRELHNLAWASQASANLGYVLYEQGLVSEARKAIEQSLSVRGQEDKNSNIAERLSSLGEILRQEDQLTGARKAFEEALALEYETGTPKAVAEKRLLLAELSLEENSPVAAEAEATEADGKLTLERVPHLHALAVIAQALVAQHKLAEARNAIEQVVPSLNDIPRYMDRLSTMIIIGRMIAMSGNRRRGMKYVNSALADASRLGYGGLQLEARLARCEIRIMSINDATDLKQLRTEAQAKGLNLIARKAAALDARRR